MSNLSSFMISFCASCILLGFLYMLCPSGSMGESVKYVFCLCFLCCVLSCVTNIPKIDFSTFDSAEPQLVTEQSAAVTAQTVFATALTDADINFTKITVDANKLQSGSITISRVTVYTAATAEQVIEVIGSDSYEVCVINDVCTVFL